VVLEYPDGRVVGIEVKSGATPSHGYLATTAPEAHPLEDRLSAIPVTALWNP